MKVLQFISMILISSNAFAWTSGSDLRYDLQVTGPEKTVFSFELEKLNPACYRVIHQRVGRLGSRGVLIYGNFVRNGIRYVVKGFNKQISLTRTESNGRVTYRCGAVESIR